MARRPQTLHAVCAYGLVVTCGVAACGPSAHFSASVPVSSGRSTAQRTDAVRERTIRFALAVEGHPLGTETWDVLAAPDGSQTIQFEAAVDTPHGRLTGSGHYRVLPSHFPDEAEVTVHPPDGTGATTFRLSRIGSDLTLSLEGGGRGDELKAGRPSNVFEPRPFFVGFAPICALLLDKNPPPLVEFPGSLITVLDRKTLAGASVFSLERGGLGRTLVACDGAEVAAVLDLWTGQSAVREGSEAVGQALSKSIARTKPPIPDDLIEQELTVRVSAEGSARGASTTDGDAAGSGDAVLACSFLRPDQKAATTRLPAVVFATALGPQDRDDDSPGHGGLKLAIFKVMAIALAEKGVSSLRCDDRGTGKSTGSFEKATLSTLVRDAEETLASVAKRPDVDPARLGFIGHSEGAVIGPLVAAQSGKLRALLLMAGPGRSLPEVGVLEEEAFLKQSGLPADEVQRQLNTQREILEAIRGGKPLPESIRSPEKDMIEKQRPWLKSHLDNDIPAALARVPKMAVFVAQGGKDIQIPPDDAELVRRGLAAGVNKEVWVKVYPELNHVFASSHGGGTVEYADADAHIDEGFLADTVSFFTQAFRSVPNGP
jgi:dienelactone hydrolase